MKFGGWLHSGAGIAVMVLLMFVPAGYGATEPWAREVMSVGTMGAFACWIAALFAQRRLPRVPSPLIALSLFIFVYGWGMALNAESAHDKDFWQFVPLAQAVDWLPGSVDAFASQKAMLRITSLLMLFMMVCDLCHRRRCAKAIVVTMGVTGALTAAFGIYQKISPTPFLIWPVPTPPITAFATFWYHGNAAAYLNLTWPLLLGLALWSFQRQMAHALRALWLLLLMVTFVGLMVNVSKAGHLLALLLGIVCLGMLAVRLPSLILRHGWKQPVALLLLATSGIAVGLATLDWNESLQRWREFSSRYTTDSRLEVAGICLQMIPAAGWFGYGPATFDAVFQHHVFDLGVNLGVRWKFAHNDYLQTIIEWGWLGSVLWILFWWFPLAAAVRCILQGLPLAANSVSYDACEVGHGGKEGRFRQTAQLGASLAILGVFAHASFDFPLQIAGIQMYVMALAGVLVAQSDPMRAARQPHA
jgi:hypothetical protein